MNMIKRFKTLDNVNKMLIVSTCVIMILLIGNLVISIRHISQFNSIRNSGNDRWFEVENRILLYEQKVDKIENTLEQYNIPTK